VDKKLFHSEFLNLAATDGIFLLSGLIICESKNFLPYCIVDPAIDFAAPGNPNAAASVINLPAVPKSYPVAASTYVEGDMVFISYSIPSARLASSLAF
jgi:hypothetical protein